MYKATGDVAYFNKAKKYYNDFSLEGKTGVFSWDDKTVGVHVLMAEFTGDKKYTDSLKKFCDNAVSGQTRSPGGMLHYAEWGSLRYASNAAFICLQVKRIFCYCIHINNLFFFPYMIMIKRNVKYFRLLIS